MQVSLWSLKKGDFFHFSLSVTLPKTTKVTKERIASQEKAQHFRINWSTNPRCQTLNKALINVEIMVLPHSRHNKKWKLNIPRMVQKGAYTVSSVNCKCEADALNIRISCPSNKEASLTVSTSRPRRSDTNMNQKGDGITLSKSSWNHIYHLLCHL